MGTELKALYAKLIENRSPAANLIEAINKHSNSKEYLIGNLTAIVNAMKADLDEENRAMTSMLLEDRENFS